MKYIFYKSFLFLLLVGIFITVPSLALAKKSSSLVQAYVPGEVIVKFKKVKINLKTSSGQASVRGFASRKGSERKADLKDQNLSVFKITDGRSVEAVIDDLKNDPDVEYAEPNYKRRLFTINTNDTYKNDLWGLDNTGQTVNGVVGTADADIDAPEAWVKSTGASTTIIAVIDTGVAYNHLDIADSMWNGINCVDENNVFLGNCNHGYDYIDNDKTPLPTISSHGTHVAGTIAAVKNNSKGIIGIAPSAKIMALRVDYVDPDGSEYIDSASVVKAISFAKNNGARIINASFGGTGFSQAEYDAIAAFGAAGGIFVAAAGNDSSNNDVTHMYPVDFNLDNIIAVGATDSKDNLASFSNYGLTSIDVAAPGKDILSLYATSWTAYENFSSLTAPNIPSGYTKTGSWGTSNRLLGNMALYGDTSYPYATSSNSIITSPTFDLSSTTISGMKFNFYIGCDTEYSNANWGDYMALEVSADGTNFTELKRFNEASIDNAAEQYLNGTRWNFDVFIPNSYYTNAFKFRFRWVANGNNDVGGGNGCSIDNLALIKTSDGSDELYTYMSGTSMATPHVAAEAALLLSYKPSLSVAQVKNIILNTGDSLSSLASKILSGRRINANNALNTLNSAAPIITSPAGTSTISSLTYNIQGTAEANSLVKAYKSNELTGSQQLSNGTTTFSMTLNLTPNTANVFSLVAVNQFDSVSATTTAPAITQDSAVISSSLLSINNGTSSPYRIGSSTASIVIKGEESMLCRFSSSDLVYSAISSSNNCAINGSMATCVINSLTDGTKNYHISCNDALGNEQTITQNLDISFVVDLTPPNVYLIAPQAGSGQVNLSIVFNEQLSSSTLSIDTVNNLILSLVNNATGASSSVISLSSATSSVVWDNSNVNMSRASLLIASSTFVSGQTVRINFKASSIKDFLGNAMASSTNIDALVLGSTQKAAASSTSVSTTETEVLFTYAQSAAISIPSSVTNATLNFSALMATTSTSTVVTLPALSLIASTSLSSSAVTVSTPANLQVSAQSGWDGIINAPRVELNSSVSVMADSGKTAAVAATLEVGAGNVALTFDQGVRLLIPGAVGKYMGYQRNSDFSKITTTCSADNQAVGDTLAVGADCKVDVGSDVVIWTKHFTKFIAYTQDNIVASVSVSSGGGGGGGGGSSVPSVVIVAPIVVAPIITPELVEEKVVRKTFEEIATPISNASTDQIEIVHDLNKEKLVDKKYIISLIKDIKQVNLATQTALINFIAYGTKITLSLGEGERAGVLGSYKSAFKKLPTSNSEWSDVIKIASGHWPSEKNLTSEKDSETAFQKIYKRKPVRSNANDDAAVTIIAYGLRPSARNTVSEKNAILSFKKIYGYAPVSATAWDIVRAIAYSGSKR